GFNGIRNAAGGIMILREGCLLLSSRLRGGPNLQPVRYNEQNTIMHLRHSILKFAVLTGIALMFGPVASAQSDKATAVITDMITTLGGKAFLDVREIQASGKVFAFKR